MKRCKTCKTEKSEEEFPKLKYKRKGYGVRSINCEPCYMRLMENMRRSRGTLERISVKSPDVKWEEKASDSSIERYISNLEAGTR